MTAKPAEGEGRRAPQIRGHVEATADQQVRTQPGVHERAEREEFTVEALYFMRDRFNQAEVWMRSGLPVDKLMEYAYNSGSMQSFRSRLFTRIVPILKEIGLFGPKVQKALGDMGVMEYAKIDVEKLLGNDLKVAEDFDAKKFVKDAIAAE